MLCVFIRTQQFKYGHSSVPSAVVDIVRAGSAHVRQYGIVFQWHSQDFAVVHPPNLTGFGRPYNIIAPISSPAPSLATPLSFSSLTVYKSGAKYLVQNVLTFIRVTLYN